MTFTHEKLDVYQSAIRFLSNVHEHVARSSKGHHDLIDQLERASLSIVLNIAVCVGALSTSCQRVFPLM